MKAQGVVATLAVLAGLIGGVSDAAAKDEAVAPAPVEGRAERPAGQYARWTLHLPGAFVTDVRSKRPKEADLRLLVWTRGGHAVQAMAESVPAAVNNFREADLSGLQVADGSVAGQIRFGMHYEHPFSRNWPNVWFELGLEAVPDGEKVSGRYVGTCAVAAAPRDKNLTVPMIEEQLAEARRKAASYEIPMVYPIVDGRLFIRGALGIYCYDLRQPDGRAQ